MTVQLKRFTDEQRIALTKQLSTIISNPYSQYYEFKDEVKDLTQTLPDFIHQLCDSIVNDRKIDERAHFIRNCPIDINAEKFDPTNPSVDKYQKKKTFIGETFLQVFAELTGSPVFRYEMSGGLENKYFIDVYGVINNKKPDPHFQELVWHGDDSEHKIMPDYITLLGMRSFEENLVFTPLIDCREILRHLSSESQNSLRTPYYYIPNKNGSTNALQDTIMSKFAILDDVHRIRYCSTRTQCLRTSPIKARDALIDLHNAIIKSNKERFLINRGCLMSFSNRYNLHSREIIKVKNAHEAHHRWLLKTFSFESIQAAQNSKPFRAHGESFVIRN
ncbi:MAG: hypothetical protein WCP46_02400 [Alphaproteobacteria bacterium]